MKRLISLALVLVFAVIFSTGCHKDNNPAGASYSDLTGTYSGSFADSTGSGYFTWTQTQSGANISGTVSATDLYGIPTYTAVLSGTITGTTLNFTINAPAGGINGRPTCTFTSTCIGTNTNNAKISGTYSGNNSCTGCFTKGNFSVSRQ